MKILFLTVIISSLYLFSSAQSTIKVYTNLKEKSAMFTVYLNGEAQDSEPWTETEIEDLEAGTYQLRVVFNGDTIADWDKRIKVPANTTIRYKVIENEDVVKELGNMGRAFGRTFKQTKKNKKKGLKQYYRVKIQK